MLFLESCRPQGTHGCVKGGCPGSDILEGSKVSQTLHSQPLHENSSTHSLTRTCFVLWGDFKRQEHSCVWCMVIFIVEELFLLREPALARSLKKRKAFNGR